MLDNCRQVSFGHETVLKQLGFKGTKTILSLKALHWERSQNTSPIAGMQVKGINGYGNWLRFPRLHARKDLQLTRKKLQLQKISLNGNISSQ